MVTAARVEELEAKVEKLEESLRNLGVDIEEARGFLPSAGAIPFLGWVDELTSGGVTHLHKHSIPSEEAIASSDLTLTTTPQDVPGCSLSLEAGTWLVTGTFYAWCTTLGAATSILGYLDVDGVDETEQAIWRGAAANNSGATVGQVWLITIAESTTVKLQAAKGDDTGDYKVPATHTTIRAIKTAEE